jgi:glycosyltransferase involved in cell wall biosynthesis
VIKEWIFENCPPKNNSKKIANQLGIMGRPVVAYVGNFAQYQGVELLIDAILKVREVIGNIVLLLVGGTENEIAGLKRKVVSLKLSNNVILIPRVERGKVAEYLSIADVLSLPRPRGENAPLKIYEYKRSGKPIVATNIPAHELLANSSTSIMVAPQVSALVNGIMLALKNGKPAADECKASSELILSKLETLPETLSDVYNTIRASSCTNVLE